MKYRLPNTTFGERLTVSVLKGIGISAFELSNDSSKSSRIHLLFIARTNKKDQRK